MDTVPEIPRHTRGSADRAPGALSPRRARPAGKPALPVRRCQSQATGILRTVYPVAISRLRAAAHDSKDLAGLFDRHTVQADRWASADAGT